MNDLTIFGQLIIRLMKEAGIEMVCDLAYRLKVKQPIVSAILRGRRNPTKIYRDRFIALFGEQHTEQIELAAARSLLNKDVTAQRSKSMAAENDRLQLELAVLKAELSALKESKQRPLVASLREHVKSEALDCGFKLKPQPDGSEDLNPYVYELAARIMSSSFGDGYYDGYLDCNKDAQGDATESDVMRYSEEAESKYHNRITEVE